LISVGNPDGMSPPLLFEVKMIHHHTRGAVMAASHEIGECFNIICDTTIFTCRFQLGNRLRSQGSSEPAKIARSRGS
jgi:hypothetical protein